MIELTPGSMVPDGENYEGSCSEGTTLREILEWIPKEYPDDNGPVNVFVGEDGNLLLGLHINDGELIDEEFTSNILTTWGDFIVSDFCAIRMHDGTISFTIYIGYPNGLRKEPKVKMINQKLRYPNLPHIKWFDIEIDPDVTVHDAIKWILQNYPNDVGLIRIFPDKDSDEYEIAQYEGGKIDKVYLEDLQDMYGSRKVYEFQAAKWGRHEHLHFEITVV